MKMMTRMMMMMTGTVMTMKTVMTTVNGHEKRMILNMMNLDTTSLSYTTRASICPGMTKVSLRNMIMIILRKIVTLMCL